MSPIPLLTVRQPWASAFFRRIGWKDVENRGWSTSHRGRVGIHAGIAPDRGGMEYLGVDAIPDRDRGVVLGTVELHGCHDAGGPGCDANGCHTNPWAFFPADDGTRVVHWMVDHPRPFVTPIRARGALNLWHPGPTLAGQLELAEVAT